MASEVAPLPEEDSVEIDYPVSITLSANEWMLLSATLSIIADKALTAKNVPDDVIRKGMAIRAMENHIDTECEKEGERLAGK